MATSSQTLGRDWPASCLRRGQCVGVAPSLVGLNSSFRRESLPARGSSLKVQSWCTAKNEFRLLHLSFFIFHVSCFMFHVSCFMFQRTCQCAGFTSLQLFLFFCNRLKKKKMCLWSVFCHQCLPILKDKARILNSIALEVQD